jgi:hypothetical protein
VERKLRLLVLAALSLLLSGCLAPTLYVDRTLPPASKEDVVAKSAPQPIQFLYEFQTKGSANARATELTRERALNVVKDSAMFSTISGEPQANQRRLTVVINNYPITQDAASRGFGVGLTFGLAGTVVTDGYDCTAVLTVPGGQPLKLNFKHALHTAIGNTAPPAGLTAEPSIQDAITKVVTQLMWSIMRDVSKSNLL